ncbi:PREDICTED: uncharacterized protein LOC108512063 isoform X1 [Rhinopithecus bieti]|uniref:uncharacterized protein LOC108512063 isoform X1 n=1 Tax=Rhinopithecus bieti TaxID=61621 RepID=UPI00083BB125|nr:PREDICTED: uncharacterized protein LOC108512063 isoform X1 [Rhinopithecus bieti]
MDGLRGACGRGAPVFGAVLAAMRDWQELRCSHLPRRPPFHIQQRRRGQPRRRFFTRTNNRKLKTSEAMLLRLSPYLRACNSGMTFAPVSTRGRHLD